MNGNTRKSLKSSTKALKRLPRPYGATALSLQCQKEGNHKSYTDFMINQWLLNNGSICGERYETNQLAQYLGVSVEEIRLKMRDQILESRIWEKGNQEKMLYGLMGQMVSWTMEDRMNIEAQVQLLMRSQGDKYTPFISAEVNKALKLKLESSTALQSVVGRLMGGGGTTNIFTFNQQNNDNSVNNTYVTASEVLEIINENEKQLDKPEQAKLLETKYDLTALPEVVATKQEGVDTTKEGLGGINLQKLSQVTDNLKGALQASDEDHHSMRREIEMKIDQDSDDPELEIYDDFEEMSGDSFSASNFLR